MAPGTAMKSVCTTGTTYAARTHAYARSVLARRVLAKYHSLGGSLDGAIFA